MRIAAILSMPLLLCGQAPQAATFHEWVTELKAHPNSWPVLKLPEPADQSPAAVRNRTAYRYGAGLIEAGYKQDSNNGRMSPALERDYSDAAEILFLRGGPPNWLLAEVLDFRVALSIASRVCDSGAVTPADRSLAGSLAKRTISFELIRRLVVSVLGPEGGPAFDQKFNELSNKKSSTPYAVDSRTRTPETIAFEAFSQLPSPARTISQESKDWYGPFLMRLYAHDLLIRVGLEPLLDGISNVPNWKTLDSERRVAAVRAVIDPKSYRAFDGRDFDTTFVAAWIQRAAGIDKNPTGPLVDFDALLSLHTSLDPGR